MKLYSCSHCKNQLYFENNVCLVCQHMVGFDAASLSMLTLVENGSGGLADIRDAKGLYRWCENATHGTCNWLIPAADPSAFCIACQLNRTIPELSEGENLARWKKIEVAKHRLVYSLLRLKLPVVAKQQRDEPLTASIPDGTANAGSAGTPVTATGPTGKQGSGATGISPAGDSGNTGVMEKVKGPAVAEGPGEMNGMNKRNAPVPAEGPAARDANTGNGTTGPLPAAQEMEDTGIAFDFMADISPDKRVMTGHDHGVITLNIEEADEAERVRNKLDLGEKYRTLLGHFRHEIGHYYWDILISDRPPLDGYRKIFGDERQDYGEALKTYYATGAPADWPDHFISPYASSHPWEDWAETWSHYMHLMDTLETAYAFGIGIHLPKTNTPTTDIRDPYTLSNFDTILRMWLPLTFAVNSLNRSMGHADFYPFVISPAVTEKLRYIHQIAGAGRKTDK